MNELKSICYQESKACYEADRGQAYQSIIEDELTAIIKKGFQMLRLYDVSEFALKVLEVIEEKQLPLKVMLGVSFKGEVINQNTSNGAILKTKDIIFNKRENQAKIEVLIDCSNRYESIVKQVCVGNDNQTAWTINMVSPVEIIKYIHMVKKMVKQPVIYAENAYFWNTSLKNIAKEVDIVGINLHPYFQDKSVSEAHLYVASFVEATIEHLNKPVIITETGWPRSSSNIENPTNVADQIEYISNMLEWSKKTNIQTYFYEAYDTHIQKDTYPYQNKFGLMKKNTN
ncbi:MAG: hypothetical protein RBQ91_05525 [Acholeplasma sp.]|nr:hypothetical protein [Acholeplasma sp.]